MRVLGIIAAIDPRSGGPPSSARNIWVAAARSGQSVSVAVGVKTPLDPGEEERLRDLAAQHITVHRFPLLRGGVGLATRWGISPAFALWILRRAGRYDLLQVHGSWTFSTLIAVLAAKLWRRKVILVPHESLTRFDRARQAGGLKHRLKRLIKSFLLRAVDEIIFSSPLERADSFDAGETVRGAVLFHPVRDERTPLPHAHPSPDGADQLRVGYLGRLDPKKNIELLLAALAADGHLTLLLAGDGPAPYRQQIWRRIAELGLESRVEGLGFVGSADKDRFFARIDLLAMPSAYECFGMAAAEALCHAVPVIVSQQTGIAELVARHGAGLVITPDAASLSDALTRLRKDGTLRRDCVAGAARLIETELSIGSYGIGLKEIYRRLGGRDREDG
jgi:glycosyltransferase involved in cell wall biosynthesis